MVSPNNIAERAREIQELIALNNLERSGLRLLDFVQEFQGTQKQRHEAIVINANLREVERSLSQNVIDFPEAMKLKNGLMRQMLLLCDDILMQPVN